MPGQPWDLHPAPRPQCGSIATSVLAPPPHRSPGVLQQAWAGPHCTHCTPAHWGTLRCTPVWEIPDLREGELQWNLPKAPAGKH